MLSNAAITGDIDSSTIPNEYANIAKFLTQGKNKTDSNYKPKKYGLNDTKDYGPYKQKAPSSILGAMS